MAAVTVTAYLIPQVMAYSSLAGLPPQTGLIVIVATLILYALIGSSRLLSVGPESTTALMTAAVLAPLALGDPSRYIALAATMALLVGGYALLAGLMRVGFIGELLSKPVLVGYMAGVAVIMIVSQIGKVTGVDVAGDTIVEDVRSFGTTLIDSGPHWPTLAIGASVAVLLLVLTPRLPRIPIPLIVMLAATLVVSIFDLESVGVQTVGEVSTEGFRLEITRLDRRPRLGGESASTTTRSSSAWGPRTSARPSSAASR